MSGIFGILDPKGVSEATVSAAARVADYRGQPFVHADGGVAFGCFVRGDEDPCFVDKRGTWLVADARIDGLCDEGVAPDLSLDAAGDFFHQLLLEHGPDILDQVAADFALAMFDWKTKTLTLARDAFGYRPLYWVSREGAVAFGSDVSILQELGFSTGELDAHSVADYIETGNLMGWHTAFWGVKRLPGGRWVSFDAQGRITSGRWFRPEAVPEVGQDLGSIVEQLRTTVSAAVTARVRGRRVGLLLSGGRDSGAVAVALADAGVKAECLTQVFEPRFGCSEHEAAEKLAVACGHSWRGVKTPFRATRSHLAALPEAAGTPLGPPGFVQFLSFKEGAADVPVEVILDGQGGEPLFWADPEAAAELLRRGMVRAAWRATRGNAENWKFSYPKVLRDVVRALVPRWRRRSEAPRLDERQRLARGLVDWGPHPFNEFFERMFQLNGQEFSSPLMDLRVVRLALSIPTRFKVPDPGPKPLLRRAFLGDLDASRGKARFTPYYEETARWLLEDFPQLFKNPSFPSFHRAEATGKVWALGGGPSLQRVLRVANVGAWVQRTSNGGG